MTTQITCNSTICATICSGQQQRKHQSSASLLPCEGNPPVDGGFPSQRASNTESLFRAMTPSYVPLQFSDPLVEISISLDNSSRSSSVTFSPKFVITWRNSADDMWPSPLWSNSCWGIWYSTVSLYCGELSSNTHKLHPIAHPSDRDMGYLL